MLTTHLEFCIPTWYWTEPEIATLMIMSGLKVVPDWPIYTSEICRIVISGGLTNPNKA